MWIFIIHIHSIQFMLAKILTNTEIQSLTASIKLYPDEYTHKVGTKLIANDSKYRTFIMLSRGSYLQSREVLYDSYRSWKKEAFFFIRGLKHNDCPVAEY